MRTSTQAGGVHIGKEANCGSEQHGLPLDLSVSPTKSYFLLRRKEKGAGGRVNFLEPEFLVFFIAPNTKNDETRRSVNGHRNSDTKQMPAKNIERSREPTQLHLQDK